MLSSGPEYKQKQKVFLQNMITVNNLQLLTTQFQNQVLKSQKKLLTKVFQHLGNVSYKPRNIRQPNEQ